VWERELTEETEMEDRGFCGLSIVSVASCSIQNSVIDVNLWMISERV